MLEIFIRSKLTRAADPAFTEYDRGGLETRISAVLTTGAQIVYPVMEMVYERKKSRVILLIVQMSFLKVCFGPYTLCRSDGTNGYSRYTFKVHHLTRSDIESSYHNRLYFSYDFLFLLGWSFDVKVVIDDSQSYPSFSFNIAQFFTSFSNN